VTFTRMCHFSACIWLHGRRGAPRGASTCLRISQPLYFLYTWNSGVNRLGGFDTCEARWGLCQGRSSAPCAPPLAPQVAGWLRD